MMMKSVRALIVAALLFPAASFAGGHAEGFVNIVPDRSMDATMNVRWGDYSTTASALFYVQGGLNGPVTFIGNDRDGVFFMCYVSPADTELYKYAVTVKNSLKDGNRLIVKKEPGNNECYSVRMTVESFSQH